MLIEFRVENHRSLAEEQVITMEAGDTGNAQDERPRRVSGSDKLILPVAALYGANASGKSNVLSAFAFFHDAVVHSHRDWSPEENIVPRDPFGWGSKRNESSFFELTAIIDEIRYQYGFVVSDEQFEEEWLHAWPKGHKRTWFERDGNHFKFYESLKGENRLIEEVTRSNALFLSTAAQHKHKQLMPLFSWISGIVPFKLNRTSSRFEDFVLARLFQSETTDLRQKTLFSKEIGDSWVLDNFRTLLKTADIGVEDVKVEKAESSERLRRHSFFRFLLRHQSNYDDAWLPLEEESNGTQTLFRLAIPLLQSIRRGRLVLIDELERSLHPALVHRIVELFNSPVTNPNDAQLIFTTHDTNLLGNIIGKPVLRRDQVWLTEKNTNGETVLYPLTDFKPRKAENIERGYLQGRYGAVPFLNEFFLAKEQ